jgi:hypothetical protein
MVDALLASPPEHPEAPRFAQVIHDDFPWDTARVDPLLVRFPVL